MKKFICKKCGTNYQTAGDEAPPTPTWNDGHVCHLIELNDD